MTFETVLVIRVCGRVPSALTLVTQRFLCKAVRVLCAVLRSVTTLPESTVKKNTSIIPWPNAKRGYVASYSLHVAFVTAPLPQW